MQRTRFLAAVAVTTIAAGLLPGHAVAADPPVTLRLAVADGEDRPSDPYVRAFVEEVAARSGGSVTIDVTWDAGSSGFERGVAHLVTDGTFDLGLSAGRAWDDVGVEALKALQAPFLIDSDALAEAVAAAPVADDLLAAMADQGVSGLALWPEDLRHPVAFEPCVAPITSPEQLAGQTVRAIPSAVTIDLLEALGATHIWVDGYDEMVARCEIQAAESGLRQGASLPGRPTFTGDVSFFPKFQVLAANASTLERLAPAQQAAIQDAARAVRDRAIAEHPTDAEAGQAWCADGGRVVLAGADAVAAFQAAAGPVIEALSADPVVAQAITAIEELKGRTEASDMAAACEPGALPSPATVDRSGFVGTLPPEGSFRAVLTEADLVAAGASSTFASMNWGTKTFTFDGTAVTLDQGEHGGSPCWGTMDVVDDQYVAVTTTGGGCGLFDAIVWQPVDGGVRLMLHEATVETGQGAVDSVAFLDRTWEQIDGPAVVVP